MPNLKPPIVTTDDARAYRDRILAALARALEKIAGDTNTPETKVVDELARHFAPLMVLYLTDQTSPAEIERARSSGIVHAVKLYPAGATTNSEAGVRALEALYPVLEAMERVDLPLLVHGEVTDSSVDVFDREKVFIERHLTPIVARFPALRVVFEHATTAEAVDFVLAQSARVAATLTAHHLLLNRNALFAGGIRPHHYCLPVLKRESHRERLVAAAVSGNPKFFLGTDSAPHPQSLKEHPCGCAGIYTAHAGIELYAEVFDAANALPALEGFASLHGPAFYGLAPNEQRVCLVKREWSVPADYALGSDRLVPLRAGGSVAWSIESLNIEASKTEASKIEA